MQTAALLGVASLYYAIFQYSKETDWFLTHSDPPAITDLGRKTKLSANLYIASITMMSTLIPFISYFVGQNTFSNFIAASGAASLQAAVVFEGDFYGKIHSNFLLIAGVLLSVWLFHLYSENIISDKIIYFLCAVFYALYCIRQSKTYRTLFVLGEYLLVFIFALFMCTLIQNK